MNASAAFQGLFGIPRAGPPFRKIETGEDAAPKCFWDDRVESIRNILSREGLTITDLSGATLRRYGSRSPYFIPATFLYQVRSGVTPHACQIVALSESTGYRFVDWLRMFGFDLQQIPRLQMQLHPERTVLVTPMEDGFDPFLFPPLLDYERAWSSSVGALSEDWSVRPRYLFAKVGSGDALFCPELLPGSMVRVDRYYADRIRGVDHASMGRLLWLVEQPSGLTCCRVQWIDNRQIVLLPYRPPWGRWPLRLPTEARILGLVDMDLRPLEQVRLQPRAGPMGLAQLPRPPYREERMRFSDLLRISRGRAGLTFRAAHGLTRSVAQILGDPAYTIALGMLSDYEAMGRLPRHIAKIFTLCAVYCMDIREVMTAAGVRIDDSAKLPLPLADRRLQLRSEFMSDASDSETERIVTGYARSAGV
jgi:hypothetical protein